MHIVRGRIRSYDAATHTADVEPVRGPAALLSGLPVVAQCPAGFLNAGREVAALLWDDVSGVVLGPYGANADNWAIRGILTSPYTPTTRATDLHPTGNRVVANNTFADIVRFTAGTGTNNRLGGFSGLLIVTGLVYCTGGYYLLRSRLYFLSVRKMYPGAAMRSALQQIGADNAIETTGRTLALTVQEKSGASASELIIEARATATDFAVGNIVTTLLDGRGAQTADTVVTATVLTD